MTRVTEIYQTPADITGYLNRFIAKLKKGETKKMEESKFYEFALDILSSTCASRIIKNLKEIQELSELNNNNNYSLDEQYVTTSLLSGKSEIEVAHALFEEFCSEKITDLQKLDLRKKAWIWLHNHDVKDMKEHMKIEKPAVDAVLAQLDAIGTMENYPDEKSFYKEIVKTLMNVPGMERGSFALIADKLSEMTGIPKVGKWSRKEELLEKRGFNLLYGIILDIALLIRSDPEKALEQLYMRKECEAYSDWLRELEKGTEIER